MEEESPKTPTIVVRSSIPVGFESVPSDSNSECPSLEEMKHGNIEMWLVKVPFNFDASSLSGQVVVLNGAQDIPPNGAQDKTKRYEVLSKPLSTSQSSSYKVLLPSSHHKSLWTAKQFGGQLSVVQTHHVPMAELPPCSSPSRCKEAPEIKCRWKPFGYENPWKKQAHNLTFTETDASRKRKSKKKNRDGSPSKDKPRQLKQEASTDNCLYSQEQGDGEERASDHQMFRIDKRPSKESQSTDTPKLTRHKQRHSEASEVEEQTSQKSKKKKTNSSFEVEVKIEKTPSPSEGKEIQRPSKARQSTDTPKPTRHKQRHSEASEVEEQTSQKSKKKKTNYSFEVEVKIEKTPSPSEGKEIQRPSKARQSTDTPKPTRHKQRHSEASEVEEQTSQKSKKKKTNSSFEVEVKIEKTPSPSEGKEIQRPSKARQSTDTPKPTRHKQRHSEASEVEEQTSQKSKKKKTNSSFEVEVKIEKTPSPSEGKEIQPLPPKYKNVIKSEEGACVQKSINKKVKHLKREPRSPEGISSFKSRHDESTETNGNDFHRVNVKVECETASRSKSKSQKIKSPVESEGVRFSGVKVKLDKVYDDQGLVPKKKKKKKNE